MELQTRKTEQIVFARTSQEMFGKFVAEDVIKKWTEDFLNEDSGEVIPIEKHEILFSRGKRIDEQNIDSVEFYLQTGDIEGIYVSDQCRKCRERESSVLKVYKAKVLVGQKNKYVFVCQANNIDMAKEIVADYIELTETADFKFLSVAEMACGTILNRNKEEYLKLKEVEEVKESSMFGEEEGEGESPAGETKEEVKPSRYYEISLNVTLRTIATKAKENDIINASVYSFLVEADDADEAKEKSLAWLKLFNKENVVIESAITLEASPFKCKKVIDREFVETYLPLPNPLP